MAKKKSVAKKKSMLTVQAKVVDVKRNDEWEDAVVLNDGKRQQPFVIYFEVVDEDLAVGDLVTVTIVKSEEKDG